MRVYVPLTLPGLAGAHRSGRLGAESFAAYAVTPALRAWYGSDDTEELEYAALTQAALASLRLLAAAPDAPRRRVVVAVDVADGAVGTVTGAEAAEPGRVHLAGSVPLARAAAVHVDSDDAGTEVAAAAAALAAADAGDGTARAAVDAAEDHDLLWFATQEVAHLVAVREDS